MASIFRIKIANKFFSSGIIISKASKRTLVLNVESHFGDSGYKLHLLDEGPAQTVELTKEAALKYYRQMSDIRKVELASASLYRKKLCRGFCHLYVGQEAVAVGINSIMRPQDTVITSYRCHGWAVLKIPNLNSFFAELLGFVSGTSRGKGGSIHVYSNNFYGGNGIVGAQVPLGVGIALRHKYNNSDAVCFTVLGDGAFNQGQVSEAFNFAKLHMLPVIFVVENNNYGMGTASQRSSANNEYFKGSTFLPGIRANGNDILSVVGTANFALKHVLDGKGPIILEYMTYRYYGHSMSDPGTSYRDREEIHKVREEKDPLKHLKLLIVNSNLATDEEVKRVQEESLKTVNEALAKAMKCQPPSMQELAADIYKSYPDKIRMTKIHTFIPHKNIAEYKKSKQYHSSVIDSPRALSL